MNLNKFYQPTDSIPAQPQKTVTGFDFDSHNDRGVVSSANIKNQSVTSEKLADDAFDSSHIADNAITTTKLDTATVITSKIAGSAVTSTKIAPLAVTNSKINDFDFSKGSGTIANSTFNNGTINSALSSGGTFINPAIGTANMTGGTFTSPHILGIATYPINAASAALSADTQFAFQTYSGSPVLVIRSGSISYYFTCAGTL
jgi:hypothetical protein